MLIRASIGMAISMTLMGFVANIWQLLILRMLLGAFSGYSSNAVALMATSTPKEHTGKVLSSLSTGIIAGTLLGPIIGGAIVSHFSYNAAFWLVGLIMAIVLVMTIYLVKEDFVKVEQQEVCSSKEIFKNMPNKRIVIGMLLTSMIIQVTDKSISPVLSLYVQDLVNKPEIVPMVSGVVASAPGLIMVLFATFFGRLGDKIGQEKILIFGLLLSLVIYVFLGLSHSIYIVILLRLMTGLGNAALSPSVQILLSKNTPDEYTGRIFSYNQSMQSMGCVEGPLIGSSISAYFDYQVVFLVCAFIIIINIANYYYSFKPLKKTIVYENAISYE